MLEQKLKVTGEQLNRWAGKRLSMLAWLVAGTGYANHAEQWLRHWESLGVFVSLRPVKLIESHGMRIPMALKRAFVHRDAPEEWQLILSPANFCPLQRKKSAYFTMYEASRFSPKMVKLINRANAVIVPCRWNAHGLRESGCIQPIHVVPLGYDDEVFKPQPMQMDGPCVFGAAGRQSHGHIRKGLNEVVSCFLKEFPNEPDVRLHVKGMQDCPTRFCFDKRVVIRDAFLKDDQLAEWYSKLTCFVSAARGEAWGLMALEASVCARPVIACLYGGHADFLTLDNCYPLSYTECPAEEAWQSGGGNWAVPDEQHLRKLMRRVYNDRQEAQAKGVKAAQDVCGFTWKNSAIRCLETLEALGAL